MYWAPSVFAFALTIYYFIIQGKDNILLISKVAVFL